MISIVIPAYNEEQNLKRIPTELLPVMKNYNYEVIIVDDGSTDDTAKIAAQLAKNKRIRLVRHRKNMGLGAGVKTGIKAARGDTIVLLDADFTFHPREIPKLLDKYREGWDCVIGTHFGGGKNNIQLHRKILSKGVNTLYQIFLGRKITAVSSIFRAYRKDALEGISMTSDDFAINAEMLFDMIKKNRKIVEVPVTLTTRIYGESKINTTREIKNHLKMLTRIAKWRVAP